MQRELAGNVPTTLQMRLLFAAGPGAVAELKLRTKHSDGFGIEGRLGPDQINNAGHPRTPAPKRQACAAGSRRGFHFVVRRFDSLGRDRFICLSAAVQ